MMNQSELGQAFRDGVETGSASNVAIQPAADGGTVLVGYGHAVYAHRSPGGHVTAFEGWTNKANTRTHAGTNSTKSQFARLSLTSKADAVISGEGIDAAPKVGSFAPPQKA